MSDATQIPHDENKDVVEPRGSTLSLSSNREAVLPPGPSPCVFKRFESLSSNNMDPINSTICLPCDINAVGEVVNPVPYSSQACDAVDEVANPVPYHTRDYAAVPTSHSDAVGEVVNPVPDYTRRCSSNL